MQNRRLYIIDVQTFIAVVREWHVDHLSLQYLDNATESVMPQVYVYDVHTKRWGCLCAKTSMMKIMETEQINTLICFLQQIFFDGLVSPAVLASVQ